MEEVEATLVALGLVGPLGGAAGARHWVALWRAVPGETAGGVGLLLVVNASLKDCGGGVCWRC